jgi:hypothetical protein
MTFDPTYETDDENDCFRKSLACYLDLPASEVPYFAPTTSNVKNEFWRKYCTYLEKEHNLDFTIWKGISNVPVEELNKVDDLLNSEKMWIAVVPDNCRSSRKLRHAIVMRGKKIVYDSDILYARVRKPKKIFFGITLQPIKGEPYWPNYFSSQ